LVVSWLFVLVGEKLTPAAKRHRPFILDET